MKCFKTNKTARLIALVFAIPLFTLGGSGIFFALLNFKLVSILGIGFSLLFITIGRFLVGKNIVTVCLQGNDLIIKKALHKTETHNITAFKELVLISLLPHNQRPNYTLGGSPEATGRAMGNIFTELANNSGKNTYANKQLAIRSADENIITLNSNYIDNSIELIDQIAQISHLDVLHITSREYFAWKRGELEKYRANPYPKSKRFLQLIEPFYKIKYLVFLPLLAFTTVLLVMNIWFNISHYQIKKMSKVSVDNNFFIVKNSHKNSDGDVFADIYTTNGKKLITQILLHEGRFLIDEPDTLYHYVYYPYDNPFYLSRVLNLDNDKEPEILFKDQDTNTYKVYDFNPTINDFEVKPLATYSTKLERYTHELKGYKKTRLSYYIGQIIPTIMAFYFLVLFILHLIVTGMKKELSHTNN